MAENNIGIAELDKPIFICHNSENYSHALALAVVLEACGYRTWVYEVDHRAGTLRGRRERKIIMEISRAMIALISAATITRGTNIVVELGRAKDRAEDEAAKHKDYPIVLYSVGSDWEHLRIAASRRMPALVDAIGDMLVPRLDFDCVAVMKDDSSAQSVLESNPVLKHLVYKELESLPHRIGSEDVEGMDRICSIRTEWVRRHDECCGWKKSLLIACGGFLLVVAIAMAKYGQWGGSHPGEVVAQAPEFANPSPAETASAPISMPHTPTMIEIAENKMLDAEHAVDQPKSIPIAGYPSENAVARPAADPIFPKGIPSNASSITRPAPAQFEAEACVLESANIMPRNNASGGKTLKLFAGESIAMPVKIGVPGTYEVVVQYSRDSSDTPPDAIHILADDEGEDSFQAKKTGEYGDGWNEFAVSSNSIGYLPKGGHEIRIVVEQVDQEGVEIDSILLQMVGTQGR